MSVLLLTMGPQLGITADLPVVGVGGAGVIRFRPIGASGPVKWTLVDSNLPAEWDSALNPDGNAVTLTTSDAETAGTFSVTVRAVDSARIPVVRSFDVRVMALPLTISGAFPNWQVGVPVTGALTISGGVPPYSGLAITAGALPAGVSLSIVGNQIVPSGSPTVSGPWNATVQVSDTLGATASSNISGDVAVITQTTWDPLKKASDITLSSGNMVAESSSGSETGGLVLSVSGKSSGKFYAEVAHTHLGTFASVGFGLKRGADNVSGYVGSDANSWGVWIVGSGGVNGATIHNGVVTNSIAVGFWMPRTSRMAVDLDAGKLWLCRFGQSGWIGGGDPEMGTTPTYSFTPGGTFYIAGCPRSASNRIQLVDSDNWSYAAPSGFGVWA